MNDLIARLTSRKFLLALASGVFGVLAAAGVVPADAVARDAALAGPLLFIGVEGAADLLERHKLSQATENDALAAAWDAFKAAQAALAAPAVATPAPAVPVAPAAAAPAA